MDYGDDPIVSSLYARERARATEMLKPCNTTMLQGLKNRAAWRKQSLDSLRDIMVTPSMLVTSGAKWRDLSRKHGTAALVQFGFRWPDMVSAGFSGKDLRTLTHAQLAHLGINATRAMECRPTSKDISTMGLSAEQLHDLGWTMDLLRATGLDSASMIDFGFSLQAWINVLGLRDIGAMGFDTYAKCAAEGWSVGDIETALGMQRPSQSTAVPTLKLHEIKFI